MLGSLKSADAFAGENVGGRMVMGAIFDVLFGVCWHKKCRDQEMLHDGNGGVKLDAAAKATSELLLASAFLATSQPRRRHFMMHLTITST